MKKVVCVLVTFSIFILYGCSSKQMYYGLQQSQRIECQKIVDKTEYDECMARLNESYEQYEKERKAE